MATTPNPIIFTNPGSLKPRKGRSFKRARRIEIVARLEAAFISDQEIANHLGITVQAIYAIKNSPEYLAKRITLSTGQLSIYDQQNLAAAEDKKDAINELNAMAINAYKTILANPTHSDYARVAKDLLDRHEATAKITKTQHSIVTTPDLNKENKAAQELVALLNGTGPSSEPEGVQEFLPAPEFIAEAEVDGL